MVYVPPYWAHRSINTGDEPLISLCIYSGDAGHDYGDIKSDGFPSECFAERAVWLLFDILTVDIPPQPNDG